MSLLSTNINLGPGSVLDFAFVAPRDGTITSIYGFFNVTAALSLTLGSVNVQAQIYTADADSSTFTPVGPVLSLPPLSGLISIGTNTSGSIGASIPITAGQKVMLVFSSTTSGLSIATTIVGFASAGITFV